MFKRGVVTLVFDDGYQKVWQNVVPLLNEFNMSGVFGIPIEGKKLQKTEYRVVRPWQDWLDIRQQGHEIASHSVNHPNLTTLSDEKLLDELERSQTMLQATTLIYPGGAVDDRVCQYAARFYKASRTVQYGLEDLPPREPMRLKSYNWSRNNFSLSKANFLAAWACLNNRWLIETFHMVDEDENEMVHTVKTSQLKRHVKFIKTLPIAVKTISQVIT